MAVHWNLDWSQKDEAKEKELIWMSGVVSKLRIRMKNYTGVVSNEKSQEGSRKQNKSKYTTVQKCRRGHWKFQIVKGRMRMRLGVKVRHQSRNKDGVEKRIVQARLGNANDRTRVVDFIIHA